MSIPAMSVIAPSICSISSILKSCEFRNKIEHDVRFRLPENVKKVLQDFTVGNNIKEYEELIFALKDIKNLTVSNMLRRD